MPNKVFNNLWNRQIMSKPRSPFIVVFNADGAQIWRMDTKKETAEADCKTCFEEHPDATFLNVCYLNGRTKVVRRNS